jgi:hypothetical protein
MSGGKVFKKTAKLGSVYCVSDVFAAIYVSHWVVGQRWDKHGTSESAWDIRNVSMAYFFNLSTNFFLNFETFGATTAWQ